jgi:hypothetical protein
VSGDSRRVKGIDRQETDMNEYRIQTNTQDQGRNMEGTEYRNGTRGTEHGMIGFTGKHHFIVAKKDPT